TGADAARASGIPNGRRICEAMALAGALAGLAGGLLVLGTEHKYPGVFRTGYGFDGIAVALIGGATAPGTALAGLFFGAVGAAAGSFFTGSPWIGLCCGALAGAAAAAVHALLSLRFRADQVVSGVALNLVALGLVTFLLEAIFGSSGVSPPVPALPRDATGHTALAWAAIAAPILLHAV